MGSGPGSGPSYGLETKLSAPPQHVPPSTAIPPGLRRVGVRVRFRVRVGVGVRVRVRVRVRFRVRVGVGDRVRVRVRIDHLGALLPTHGNEDAA